MEASIPFFGATPARAATGAAAATGRKGAPELGSIGAEAHGAAFFSSGHDLDNVDFALPDANKHKPTKEEYQSLLQEFSVMFRIDKRSKRQRVAIAVVVATIVLGVITFGVLLVVDGQRKQNLIKDSKDILAVFSLPYQTSVTVQVGGEDDAAAGAGGAAAVPGALGAKPAAKAVAGSQLSKKLVDQLRAKRPRVARVAGGLVGGGGGKLSAEDEKRIRAMEAIARQQAAGPQVGPGGKVEGGPSGLAATKASPGELKAMCAQREGRMRGCAQKYLGGGSFKVRLSIGADGKVVDVRAEAGDSSDELTNCVRSEFKSISLGPQGSSYSHTCSMD